MDAREPLLKNLKVFGFHTYVHVPKEKRSKFDARSTLCCLLGHLDHEKAFRFEEISGSRILESRDAQLMEETFDSGKYAQTSDSNISEYSATDEAKSDEDYNVHNNDIDSEVMNEQAPDPLSIH